MVQLELPHALSVLAVIFAWIFILGYRRLYYHPLSSFPGPRLAALTKWYAFYYDVLRHGALLRHKSALHNTYGDIVRVGPNELSFRDPRAYNDIYAPGSRFMKDPDFYKTFGLPKSSFGLTDPMKAKERRECLLPFFSRRAILKLEHVIQQTVDTLVQSMISQGVEDTPINLSLAFRCTALEIIMLYCLNYSPSAMAYPGFRYPFLISLERAIHFNWVMKYIPAFRFLMDPPRIFSGLLPQNICIISEFRFQIARQLDRILANPDKLHSEKQREIIYDFLIGHDVELRNKVLSREELYHEATVLLLAGSDTVGNTCTVGFFHVLNNPAILQRLVHELDHAWPDPEFKMSMQILEKLPYLTTVIKESLRLSHSSATGMPRIVGPHDTTICEVIIPAGTVVSISSTYVHLSPTIFSSPNVFDPDRWLSPEAKRLESFLVPFSRGPRSCLGVNLAWSELYLIFGTVFRKLELSLHNTTEDDFKMFDDFSVPIWHGRQIHVTTKRR